MFKIEYSLCSPHQECHHFPYNFSRGHNSYNEWYKQARRLELYVYEIPLYHQT